MAEQMSDRAQLSHALSNIGEKDQPKHEHIDGEVKKKKHHLKSSKRTNRKSSHFNDSATRSSSKERKSSSPDQSSDRLSTENVSMSYIKSFPGGTFTAALNSQPDSTGYSGNKQFTIIDLPGKGHQKQIQNFVQGLATHAHHTDDQSNISHAEESSSVTSATVTNTQKRIVQMHRETQQSYANSEVMSSGRNQFSPTFVERLNNKCSISDLDETDEEECTHARQTIDTKTYVVPGNKSPARHMEIPEIPAHISSLKNRKTSAGSKGAEAATYARIDQEQDMHKNPLSFKTEPLRNYISIDTEANLIHDESLAQPQKDDNMHLTTEDIRHPFVHKGIMESRVEKDVDKLIQISHVKNKLKAHRHSIDYLGLPMTKQFNKDMNKDDQRDCLVTANLGAVNDVHVLEDERQENDMENYINTVLQSSSPVQVMFQEQSANTFANNPNTSDLVVSSDHLVPPQIASPCHQVPPPPPPNDGLLVNDIGQDFWQMVRLSVAKKRLRSHRDSIKHLGSDVISKLHNNEQGSLERTSVENDVVDPTSPITHLDRSGSLEPPVPPAPPLDPGFLANEVAKDCWQMIRLSVAKKRLRSHRDSIKHLGSDVLSKLHNHEKSSLERTPLEDDVFCPTSLIDHPDQGMTPYRPRPLQPQINRDVSAHHPIPAPPPLDPVFIDNNDEDDFLQIRLSVAKTRLRSHRDSIKHLGSDVLLHLHSMRKVQSSPDSTAEERHLIPPPPPLDPGLIDNNVGKDFWQTVRLSVAKKRLRSHRDSIKHLGSDVLSKLHNEEQISQKHTSVDDVVDPTSPITHLDRSGSPGHPVPPPPPLDPGFLANEVAKDCWQMIRISVAKKKLRSHRDSIKHLGSDVLSKLHNQEKSSLERTPLEDDVFSPTSLIDHPDHGMTPDRPVPLPPQINRDVSAHPIPAPPPLDPVFIDNNEEEDFLQIRLSVAKTRLRSHRDSIKHLGSDVLLHLHSMRKVQSSPDSTAEEDSVCHTNQVTRKIPVQDDLNPNISSLGVCPHHASPAQTPPQTPPPPPPVIDRQILNDIGQDRWKIIRLAVAKRKLRSHRKSINYLGSDVRLHLAQNEEANSQGKTSMGPKTTERHATQQSTLVTDQQNEYKAKSAHVPTNEDPVTQQLPGEVIYIKGSTFGVSPVPMPPAPPLVDPGMLTSTMGEDRETTMCLSIAEKKLRTHRDNSKYLGDDMILALHSRLGSNAEGETKPETLTSKKNITDDANFPNYVNITKGFRSNEIRSSCVQMVPDITIQQPSYRTIEPTIEADDNLLAQIDVELADVNAVVHHSQENAVTNGSAVHFTTNGRYLYELYQHDQLTDLTIVVGMYTFKAHAAVLSCHSEYISGIVKKRLPVDRVTLNAGVSPAAFQVALLYMYTGDLDINGDNASEVLECAETLKISTIVGQCHSFLNHMAPEDLLEVIQMALQAGVKEVTLTKEWRVVTGHFCTIVKSPKFLNMDVATVSALVSRDDIKVGSELDVAQAVFYWLMHTDDRLQYAQQLVAHVRCLLMTSQQIVYVMSKFKSFMQNVAVKQTMLEYLWYRTSIENDIDCNMFGPMMPKSRIYTQEGSIERIPSRKSSRGQDVSCLKLAIETDNKGVTRISTQDLLTLFGRASSTEPHQDEAEVESCDEDHVISPSIFVIGGFGPEPDTGSQGRSVEQYDVKKDRWKHFSMLPEARNKHAVVISDENVYVLGGSITPPMAEQEPTNVVFKLNIPTGSWETTRPMRSARMYHVAAILGGKIYAIGGQSKNDTIISSAEYYNPVRNVWMKAPTPHYRRMAAACAVYNHKIYIAGGFGYQTTKEKKGDDRTVLDTVECYDRKTKSWTIVAQLPYPKTNGRLAVLGHSLYSFGGLCPSGEAGPNQAFEHAMFIDVYDNKSDTWTSVTTLSTPRCDPGIAVVGSRLYVIGGMDLKDIMGVDTVEQYDVETGMWSKMASLPSTSSGPQCAAFTLATQ